MSEPLPRLLLVEDEPSLVLTLSDRLASEGYDVAAVGNGSTALERLRAEAFDLVLLDVMLPGKNGFDVCRDLRRRGIDVPVLMLTARGEVADRVVGLKLGADDYLVKPFETIELLARIEALLRRRRPESGPLGEAFAFDDVRIDFRAARVLRQGEPLELSALEYKLLKYFVEHRGALLSRDELLDKVWGYDATPATRTVDVHVASLRQKIEKNPAHPERIRTVHRLGYRFAG
ncbi:MAG TPA: response regulator transcription factor [Thermoanaerobaculia bacterium]|nr:response regulator transcription factor [Thermoanaerobaculia bacterium]